MARTTFDDESRPSSGYEPAAMEDFNQFLLGVQDAATSPAVTNRIAQASLDDSHPSNRYEPVEIEDFNDFLFGVQDEATGPTRASEFDQAPAGFMWSYRYQPTQTWDFNRFVSALQTQTMLTAPTNDNETSSEKNHAITPTHTGERAQLCGRESDSACGEDLTSDLSRKNAEGRLPVHRQSEQRATSIREQPDPQDCRGSSVDPTISNSREVLAALLDNLSSAPQSSKMKDWIPWITSLAQSDSRTSLLIPAVGAYCLATLSMVYGDQQLKWVSRASYGRAVDELFAALSFSRKMQSKKDWLAMLMSMRCLGLVEMCYAVGDSTDDDAMASLDRAVLHSRGEQSFLRDCGPNKFVGVMQSALSQDADRLKCLQSQSVLLGLAERKACVFGERGWWKLEWGADPEGRSHFRLFNIGAKLPALLERADDLSGKMFAAPKLRKDLLRLRDKLDEWLQAHEHLLERIAPDMRIGTATAEGVFNGTYRTHSAIHCFCWFFCIMANCTLLRIGAMSGDPQPSDYLTLQLEICEWMYELCRMEPTSPLWFGSYWLLLATSYFDHVGLTSQYQWCLHMRDRIEARSTASPHRAACQIKWHPWKVITEAALPASIRLPGHTRPSGADDVPRKSDGGERTRNEPRMSCPFSRMQVNA